MLHLTDYYAPDFGSGYAPAAHALDELAASGVYARAGRRSIVTDRGERVALIDADGDVWMPDVHAWLAS